MPIWYTLLVLGVDILHVGRSVFSGRVVDSRVHFFELPLTISGDEEEYVIGKVRGYK